MRVNNTSAYHYNKSYSLVIGTCLHQERALMTYDADIIHTTEHYKALYSA
jgi:hypothetical protein